MRRYKRRTPQQKRQDKKKKDKKAAWKEKKKGPKRFALSVVYDPHAPDGPYYVKDNYGERITEEDDPMVPFMIEEVKMYDNALQEHFYPSMDDSHT